MKLINLKTNSLGRNILFYEKIDSTQDEIGRMIEKGTIKNGTIVMAEIQNKGKGTHGRIWHTDETNNIAFSIYIEMFCKIEKIEGITLEIARILVEILQAKYGITIQIKQPNDLMLNYKKIGGILTESKISSAMVKYLVIGIGINTSQMKFKEDIQEIATSLKKETGIEVDRMELISLFCNQLEKTIKRRCNR